MLLVGFGLGGAAGMAAGEPVHAGALGFEECRARPDDCRAGRRGPAGTIVFGVTGRFTGFGALVGAAPGARPGTPGTVPAAAGSPGVAPGTDRVTDDDDSAEPSSSAAVLALVAPASFVTHPSGTSRYNEDLLAEEPRLVSTRPQTVVYKIRAAARWSDGMPISVSDYVYQWRIHSAATCPSCGLGQRGYSRIASVTGSDNGKTVTVAFREPYAEWRALFDALLPAHVAAGRGDLSTDAGLAASVAGWSVRPEWSGGPYVISAYRRDTQVELVPNQGWYGAATPTLEKLVVRFFASRMSAVDALERGEIDALRMLPDTTTADRIRGLVAASGGGEAGGGIGYQFSPCRDWVRLDLNTASASLADVTLRRAIFMAVDTREIVEAAVGRILPGSLPRYSHNLFPGQPGYRDVQRTVEPVQGDGDVERAVALLGGAGYGFGNGVLTTPAGTPVPPLRLRYVTSDPARPAVASDPARSAVTWDPARSAVASDPARSAVAALVRDAAARLGLTVTLEPVDDLAATLGARDFDLLLRDEPEAAGSGSPGPDRWLGDAPGNVMGWRNAESDGLLTRAAGELDEIRRHALLNQQDEIMTRDAVVLALYQRPSLIVAATRYVNLRDNPASGIFTYNADRWGVRAPAAARGR